MRDLVNSCRPWGQEIVLCRYCDNGGGKMVRWTGGEKVVLHRGEKIRKRLRKKEQTREREYSQHEGQEIRKEGRKEGKNVVKLKRITM